MSNAIKKRILITGGAGFIGSALIRYLLKQVDVQLLNLDKLTYAANPNALLSVATNPQYQFKKLDICNRTALLAALVRFKPDAVIHLAAESHVDRSIDAAADFMQTNIQGSFNLLQASLEYWQNLGDRQKTDFRFLYVSTDEVFGELDKQDKAWDENAAYAPSSPYSASKAAADHLVHAWHRTYGLPTLVTHSSNNYGPFQDAEKLIPKLIQKALRGESLPIYGAGDQIRDWIYVTDHVRALIMVLNQGNVGEHYNIGGDCQMSNINVAENICRHLNQLAPQSCDYFGRFEQLIRFVEDRPGHDRRYALDCTKIKQQLGWQQQYDFVTGLEKTITSYLEQP